MQLLLLMLFAVVLNCGVAIFGGLREQIFAVRDDQYFLRFSVQVAITVDFYQYMQKNPAIIENCWKKCGISDALANGIPWDDPFVPI